MSKCHRKSTKMDQYREKEGTGEGAIQLLSCNTNAFQFFFKRKDHLWLSSWSLQAVISSLGQLWLASSNKQLPFWEVGILKSPITSKAGLVRGFFYEVGCVNMNWMNGGTHWLQGLSKWCPRWEVLLSSICRIWRKTNFCAKRFVHTHTHAYESSTMELN